MSPRQGKRGKIPNLPNNVGKKSVNDAGPKQGHDSHIFLIFHKMTFWSHTSKIATVVILRHHVTCVVSALTNPNNLKNDLSI